MGHHRRWVSLPQWRAIDIVLVKADVCELIIHDPNADRVPALLALVVNLGRGPVKVGPVDPTGCNMGCNIIPLGMAAGDPLPVAAALLALSMFVGDVIAGHGETPFLAVAPCGNSWRSAIHSAFGA